MPNVGRPSWPNALQVEKMLRITAELPKTGRGPISTIGPSLSVLHRAGRFLRADQTFLSTRRRSVVGRKAEWATHAPAGNENWLVLNVPPCILTGSVPLLSCMPDWWASAAIRGVRAPGRPRLSREGGIGCTPRFRKQWPKTRLELNGAVLYSVAWHSIRHGGPLERHGGRYDAPPLASRHRLQTLGT